MRKNRYLFPFIMITSLFFMWGFAYGLLDVLNKHFQEALNITKARSTQLQAAYFGAYFLVALPAGLFMNKYGYKRGIILGLLLYAIGAFLFYPAAENLNFDAFLLALFILASGLACLETAANPYVTVLGVPETSTARLNLSQCFNGVGSFLGPIIASYLFFGERGGTVENGNLDSVKMIYVIIGILVLLVAGLFIRMRLPEIKESEIISAESLSVKSLFSHNNFIFGIAAQFFYVAAQVGVAALFINYCTESGIGIDNSLGAKLLSGGLILFTAGRFVGTAVMRIIQPSKLLALYAAINVVLCVIVICNYEWISVYALMAVFFFMSIMFPTIFALSIKDLGQHTKKASSFLIMSIAGGALMPYIMGVLADKYSTPVSYLVPLVCFIIVFLFGIKSYKVEEV